MRPRLHFDASPSTELDTDRLRFAGQPLELLTGGSGMFAGAGTVTPSSANASIAGSAAAQPHVGVIALVLFAVAVLFLLDRAGFRFAVTAGGRR